ncbi:hypothetical protein [Streptomyces sp. NPDC053079]|uniref:hypothetical protein n=1 Tax=Streptomyces sp. NPDC053079 TaxID=3365697 RepID=UPI0037D7E2D6
MVAVTAQIEIDHGHYLLEGDAGAMDFAFTGFNGLVASVGPDGCVTDGGVWGAVSTGMQSGSLQLTVDVLDAPPLPPSAAELESYSEIVEVSLDLGGQEAGVFSLPEETNPWEPDEDECEDGDQEPPRTAGDVFPRFSCAGPGPYRVRVHARGRDASRNGDTAAEEHLIRVWAAPVAAETVYQASDRCGASLRS